MRPSRRPTILYDLPPDARASNPYTRLFLAAVADHVTALTFSWSTALFGRYDAVHLNWPEQLTRSPGRAKTLAKYPATLLFALRLAVTRTPVVRTVHNLAPHASGPWIEQRLLAWFSRRTIIEIYLNESPENDDEAGVVILHGEYPAPASARPPRSSSTRSLLTFGLLRPFKGIEQLVEAIPEVRADVALTIAGSADDRAYAADIARLVAATPRARLIEKFLSDSELDALIDSADLVVLPYRYMYNSGAALLALSRGRRVLLPDTPSTRTLQDEVGRESAALFEQPLTAAQIDAAIEADAGGDSPRPDLSRREWPHIAALHRELYDAVLAMPRGLAPRRARPVLRDRLAHSAAFVAHSARNRPVGERG